MKAFVILALVACGLLLSGCVFVKIKDGSLVKTDGKVAGNGITAEKTFEIGTFSRLDLDIPADVEYTKSDECALTIRMDENLFEYLNVSVENGMLKIGSSVSFRNFKKLEAVLSSPTLERLECNGAVDFISKGTLSGEDFTMLVNGAADVDIPNLDAKEASFKVNGAGDINVNLLDAESVSLAISGAGDANLSGKAKAVKVTVNGTGDVDLTQLDYESLDKKVNGVGSIKTGNKTR